MDSFKELSQMLLRPGSMRCSSYGPIEKYKWNETFQKMERVVVSQSVKMILSLDGKQFTGWVENGV